MDIETLTEFFGWMTVINFVLLMVVNAMFCLAPGFVYGIVNGFYPMSREQFSMASYLQIQFFKALWAVFNLVPFWALLIMDSY